MVKQIQVEELQKLMQENPNLVLIDCREKDEYEYCRIPGAKLMPLSEFRDVALKELQPTDAIFIHCHHGGRSNRACEFLEEHGFADTTNVAGGIDAWSLRVDNSIKRY